MNQGIRAIAFYLPQFHPIPENDEWWGQGFTEWRNVVKAKPLFPGHYQPHLPSDLGFYDLRLPEVREAQANLAKQYGIYGFCYYHYWFNGRRILQRPFQEVLTSSKPYFPFCLCWANENWSRAWDGGEEQVLLQQKYSAEDDRNHILHLLPALRDQRYIRINGRPLILIYRTELLPAPATTAEIWRHMARKHGIGDLYLARVENFTQGVDPRTIGFDAAVEFSPDSRNAGRRIFNGPVTRLLSRFHILPKVFSQHTVFRYSAVAEGKKRLPLPPYPQFRCVTPMWDNTPRKKLNGRVLLGATPQLYQDWLHAAVNQTRQRFSGDERIVFLNAWNEWAEGCHLEPDMRWGLAYLEATNAALRAAESQVADAPTEPASTVPLPSAMNRVRRRYWRAMNSARYLTQVGRSVIRMPMR